MNIRRYLAKDMRSAFKLVRDELGPDVVILSTRRVKGQIELTVASDRNPLIENQTTAVKEVVFPTLQARPPTSVTVAAVQDTPAQVAAAAVPLPAVEPAREREATRVAAVPSAVDDELRALRRLLETQLAALSWNDMSRRSPIVAELLRELSGIGIRRDLAADLLEGVEGEGDLATARRRVRAALADRISVTGDRWAEQGGMIAVVGPAGAGKTTALAALAARWVMRNGTQGAALISVGESRFGVQENLARVGRLVGIAVYVLDKFGELPPLLQRLGDRRMILIDTAGCSPRSASFERHVQQLRETLPDAEFALVLSAATQIGSLREVVMGYAGLGKLSGIVTHTDECTTLGGLLSATIEARVPIAYTLDGQRLLDDLRPARGESLVDLAFALAERERAQDDGSSVTMEERLHGS